MERFKKYFRELSQLAPFFKKTQTPPKKTLVKRKNAVKRKTPLKSPIYESPPPTIKESEFKRLTQNYHPISPIPFDEDDETAPSTIKKRPKVESSPESDKFYSPISKKQPPPLPSKISKKDEMIMELKAEIKQLRADIKRLNEERDVSSKHSKPPSAPPLPQISFSVVDKDEEPKINREKIAPRLLLADIQAGKKLKEISNVEKPKPLSMLDQIKQGKDLKKVDVEAFQKSKPPPTDDFLTAQLKAKFKNANASNDTDGDGKKKRKKQMHGGWMEHVMQTIKSISKKNNRRR
jgi:hypothetical protein